MLKVDNIGIVEKRMEETKELEKINKLMNKYGIKDPMSKLPVGSWHEVKFNLLNTYAGFANAIRRMLIEELPVKCLTFDEKALETDDEFILSDLLVKNINLIPIRQEINMSEYESYSMFLYKYNDTNNIISVKASDIRVVLNEKNKNKKDTKKDKESHKDESKNKGKDIPLDSLIPESNIIVIRLRPGKYIKITELSLIEGQSKTSASKFSLLNNVKYEPTDMKPYDALTGTGTRSIEYDPKEFALAFTTAGNIQPSTVMKLLCDSLRNRLEKCKDKLVTYIESKQTGKYYYANGLEIEVRDDIYHYKYPGEYITIAYMLAQRCYMLDTNIQFCSPAIDRYDNEIGIVKLKHADPSKLLLKALDACIGDVDILQKAFSKA
jgi:hypothetical protein